MQTNLSQNAAEKRKAKKKSAHPGLFLKFESENDSRINKVKVITSVFDGSTPLYFYYCDTGKYVLMPKNEFVEINETMVKELKNILGSENVAVVL